MQQGAEKQQEVTRVMKEKEQKMGGRCRRLWTRQRRFSRNW